MCPILRLHDPHRRSASLKIRLYTSIGLPSCESFARNLGHILRRWVVGAVVVLAGAACHHAETSESAPTPVGPSSEAVASAAPVDHLAQGELIEGGQQAFGVTLPRDLQIEESFTDVVYANGHVPIHALVQYLRDRLQEGGVREGADAATFDHVKVRGRPGLELQVRIAVAPQGTRVEIRDTTPPPAPSLPDETARWKQVGLTPDGHLANPKHLD